VVSTWEPRSGSKGLKGSETAKPSQPGSHFVALREPGVPPSVGGTLVPPPPSYKQHKTDGVSYCSQILEKNPIFSCYKEFFLAEKKKKDDLADCFLQGLWYVRNKNKITIADDLNIKLVTLS